MNGMRNGGYHNNLMQTTKADTVQKSRFEKEQLTLQKILNRLNMKSIEELLLVDSLNVQKIAHRQKMHPEEVQFLLAELHQRILTSQLLSEHNQLNSQKKPLIHFGKIFPQIDFYLEQGELVEVLGRSNSGKTYLMAEIMNQAIDTGLQPILLWSGSNEQVYKTKLQKMQFMSFEFKNLCDLSMLIHSLGNHIIKTHSHKYIVLIDCLSQIELQEENIEFDSSQKFRRLINTFTNRTQTTLIYSYRINNSLFRTQYKKDHYRPKCRNSKEWDGWSGKSIFVDHLVRKKDLKIVLRLNFPKSLDTKLHEIVL